ncbi:peptide deformylase [Pontibacter silvestris]|uniref:Peptide deformylase n=1 Tax=Pontibacter silvestris TaxID=2305183 RepID=A0ABW4WXN8_9BACT|nr:peptide deformylase [Pontibacter silvestris]MCC9136552.1 peptide deformylase [Pontibacter silvestris]
MIYPIIAYGDPVLKEPAQDIPKDFPDLKELVEDMFTTMYHAHGVGLAAPQINKSIRLFVIDSEPMMDDEEKGKGVKRAFINPEIIEEDGEDWGFEEGCLSIPGVREVVYRPERIVIRYFDEDWNEHEDTYDGMTARVIQHEYDHVEGILFTDHLSGLTKRLIKNRLNKISKGDVDADYRMKFPTVSKKR